MLKETEYPSKETVRRLTVELGLEGTDEFTQDWECEVAKAEQLNDYIEYYNKQSLNTNEKATLMRIIIEAYNIYLIMNPYSNEYISDIKKILINDYDIHKRTLEYWSCEGEELEDEFAISNFVRDIIKQK